MCFAMAVIDEEEADKTMKIPYALGEAQENSRPCLRVKGKWKLHMKFVDEFRDPVAAEGLLAALRDGRYAGRNR